MEIRIKNIGAIGNLSMELTDLTVIAGKNDLGKSTIGKIIYSSIMGQSKYCFDVFEKDKKDMIEWILSDVRSNNREDEVLEEKIMEYRMQINMEGNVYFLVKDILDYLISLKNIDDKNEIDLLKDVLSTEIGSTKAYQNTFHKIIKSEFEGQIQNYNKKEEIGEIEFKKKGVSIFKVSLNDTKIIDFKMFSDFESDMIFYLESPFLLDLMHLDINYLGVTHMSFLLKKLREQSNNENIFNNLIEDKYSGIYQKIYNIINGEIVYEHDRRKLVYKKENKEIGFKNTATGIKVLGMIQMLLQQRKLTSKSWLILDEPEVHLHPEWQIKLAEILVLMIKELNLKITVTSHSPYFIEALKVFSDKYLSERQNFYLAKASLEGTSFENVTDNLSKVFDELSEPFDLLDEVFFGEKL